MTRFKYMLAAFLLPARYSLLPFLFFVSACGQNTVLKEHIVLPSYPSASGIESFQDKYYVIGDDANYLYILNRELKAVDSLRLYAFKEKRIPKSEKADLESVTITRDKKLFLLGSGSLSPYRNRAWLIDPLTKQKDSINLDTFYRNLAGAGIDEINIEGVTAFPGGMIMANRGNKNYPRNHLVVTSAGFWKNQDRAPLSLVLTGSPGDTSLFNGISGLAYSPKSDRLLLSVSTEDTRNALDDGTIGKSYIWIIKNISSKIRWKAVNPDQVIDLEAIDAHFKGQKIESVCVTKETANFLYIVLAADNDNGSSSFFRMIIEKK